MKKLRLFIVGFLVLLSSCENELPVELDVLPIPEDNNLVCEDESFVPYEGMMQLGEKLENPYSVTNMRRALELLPAESRNGYVAEDVQPTHLYVKFKPANVDELDALYWSDESLDFYSFPLDYERIQNGSYYHDPSLPADVPTYQYVSIPVERPIPDVCDYEILEELYIPEEVTEQTRSLSPMFINAIVKKSFELTNNKYTCDAVATRSDGVTRASYTYSGRIRVFDELIGDYIPVPGALIKCTHWFTTVRALTNTNGIYTMTRESQNEYTYYIYWERDDMYDIRDGELEQAVSNGPKQVAGWSIDIGTSSPRGINYATIGRAAYRYFYANTGGIYKMSPPSTGNLKICYKHTYHEDGYWGQFLGLTTLGTIGDIWIYARKSETEKLETHQVFATAIHEMGHANEYNAKTVLSYQVTDDFIHESWARLVQAYICYLEYGELGLYELWTFSFEDFCSLYQYEIGIRSSWNWTSQSQNDYSCLFIDLYDNYNQREHNNGNTTYPNDNIRGYFVSDLNNYVNQSQQLSDLRQLLKSKKPSTVTDAMIDELIDFYNTYKPE